jgi:hypothetical protein
MNLSHSGGKSHHGCIVPGSATSHNRCIGISTMRSHRVYHVFRHGLGSSSPLPQGSVPPADIVLWQSSHPCARLIVAGAPCKAAQPYQRLNAFCEFPIRGQAWALSGRAYHVYFTHLSALGVAQFRWVQRQFRQGSRAPCCFARQARLRLASRARRLCRPPSRRLGRQFMLSHRK